MPENVPVGIIYYDYDEDDYYCVSNKNSDGTRINTIILYNLL